VGELDGYCSKFRALDGLTKYIFLTKPSLKRPRWVELSGFGFECLGERRYLVVKFKQFDRPSIKVQWVIWTISKN
jgi:hypothetical protein